MTEEFDVPFAGADDQSRLTAAGLDRITVEHVPGVSHCTILFDPHAAGPVADRVVELAGRSAA
ncbi:hypothetical protein [Actinoplanes sp. NPDC049265]|uniref:hypothetical protein n=1 Tax=Actinoplanes sp. NPDC049265 TaxID=3363902 RepID=UPI00371BA4B9